MKTESFGRVLLRTLLDYDPTIQYAWGIDNCIFNDEILIIVSNRGVVIRIEKNCDSSFVIYLIRKMTNYFGEIKKLELAGEIQRKMTARNNLKIIEIVDYELTKLNNKTD